MKILIILLLLWLGITFQSAFNIVHLQEEVDFQFQRRALITFRSTLDGCMTGAYYENDKVNLVAMYRRCLELAYRQKHQYIIEHSESGDCSSNDTSCDYRRRAK